MPALPRSQMGRRPTGVNCALSQCNRASRARALCRPSASESCRASCTSYLPHRRWPPPGEPGSRSMPSGPSPINTGPIVNPGPRAKTASDGARQAYRRLGCGQSLFRHHLAWVSSLKRAVARERQPDDTMVSRGWAANSATLRHPRQEDVELSR